MDEHGRYTETALAHLEAGAEHAARTIEPDEGWLEGLTPEPAPLPLLTLPTREDDDGFDR